MLYLFLVKGGGGYGQRNGAKESPRAMQNIFTWLDLITCSTQQQIKEGHFNYGDTHSNTIFGNISVLTCSEKFEVSFQWDDITNFAQVSEPIFFLRETR